MLVRPGPATYVPGPDGEPSGFDVDLLRLFATQKKLLVRFVTAAHSAQLLADIAVGAAHVGAGGLYRPDSASTDAAAIRTPREVTSDVEHKPPAEPSAQALWTTGYYAIEPTLIYNGEGFKPEKWDDLLGETVAYVDGGSMEPELAKLRRAHPEIEWDAMKVPSVDALISQVSDGTIDYAIVASNEAAVVGNAYLGYETAFTVGGRRDLAWAVAPQFATLRDELDAFLAQLKRDGTLRRLADRYFVRVRLPRIDAGVFQDRTNTVLPLYRTQLQDAQEATGIEWRLLAAIAYQESQWDPLATSETGVRGLMQLTEDTARHLGVVDRLDPKASIIAAARYMRDLKRKMPARIQEPDRTWLALAAFNIGIAHLEDARVLAQKQKLNPDVWNDVKKVLPLLAEPEYHIDAKYGYARGGMPVAFVDRVRGYYDILLAQQPALQPRLRMLSTMSPEREMSQLPGE